MYHLNRADAFNKLERYKEAVQDTLSAIDNLKPAYGNAYARLGLSKYLMNDLEGSVAAYKTALIYDSDNTESRSYLSKVQLKLRRQKYTANVLVKNSSKEDHISISTHTINGTKIKGDNSTEKFPSDTKQTKINNEKDALDGGSDVKKATTVSWDNIPVWNEDIYQNIQIQQSISDLPKIIQVDNEIGYINKNKQLVVDVNETYLFWNDGQRKLCKLLQNMTLASSLDATAPVPSAVLNATIDCIDQNTEHNQGLGQGNWVTAIYASKMATHLAGVDFKFQCLDGQNSKMNLLLPWFDRYQVANLINRTIWSYGGERPNTKEACPAKYPFLRIDKM